MVIPPIAEASNRDYVERVVRNLRAAGAVVISATGLHGKDVIIDEQIVYAGSMNWSSHRGRAEVVHRIGIPDYARHCSKLLQTRFVRQAAVFSDGSQRLCPVCGSLTRIVNQRRQHGAWDLQAMKVGCANTKCKGYLRNIDERPPMITHPRCSKDGKTKYRRVKRGRGYRWVCPKHPRDCPATKVVPGDPE